MMFFFISFHLIFYYLYIYIYILIFIFIFERKLYEIIFIFTWQQFIFLKYQIQYKNIEYIH